MTTEASGASELERLTGVRSGKGTFYPQYRGAAERLERVVHALDTISRALVRTVEGPETLVRAVAEAARTHLDAEWVLFALADGALPDAGPRHLMLGRDGSPYAFEGMESARPPGVSENLPSVVLNRLNDILRGRFAEMSQPVIERHHAHIPIELDGGVVGAFAAWTPMRRVLDATDEAVLRILASQTAVALQNSALFQTEQALLKRAEGAYETATRHAADLAMRNAELQAMQRELGLAQRHQVIDNERNRIARELHDSVTQCVLSAGMQIEVCRSEVSRLTASDPSRIAEAAHRDQVRKELTQRLDMAKQLTRTAVEQLRSAIYALNHPENVGRSSLPELLQQLSTVHMPDDLRVEFRVEGSPTELTGEVEHALIRIAGEALFNTAAHANAGRAILRLTYRPADVTLSVADDGGGDPEKLRIMLKLAQAGDIDGRHRGLANMQARARELGGIFQVRRARIGGIRVTARIPTVDAPEAKR